MSTPVVRKLTYGRYVVNGEPAVSVTAALGILGVDALAAWGQRTAVAGICELARAKRLYRFDDEDRIFEALKARVLRTGSVAAKARALGTAMHEALELIIAGEVLHPEEYPEPESGYVHALLNGIKALEVARFLGSEVIVGSAAYAYAGTYDTLLEDQRGQRVRLDLKTSSGVFESHHLQLAAYEAAAVECGEQPSDCQVGYGSPLTGPSSWSAAQRRSRTSSQCWRHTTQSAACGS